jgi:hypothetical protein
VTLPPMPIETGTVRRTTNNDRARGSSNLCTIEEHLTIELQIHDKSSFDFGHSVSVNLPH